MATRVTPLFAQTANGSNSSSGVDVSVVAGGVGSMSIPPNYLVVGKQLRLTARGFYSTVAVPGTLLVKLNAGGTILASTLAQALPASRASQYWKFEIEVTVRSIGAAGTLQVHGEFFHMETAGSVGSPTVWTAFITGTVAIDTTVAQLLDLLTNFNTAGNNITATQLVLEDVF